MPWTAILLKCINFLLDFIVARGMIQAALNSVRLPRLIHRDSLRVRAAQLVPVRIVKHGAIVGSRGDAPHFRSSLLDHVAIGDRDCVLLVKDDIIELVAGEENHFVQSCDHFVQKQLVDNFVALPLQVCRQI